jgi:hypothetical protein
MLLGVLKLYWILTVEPFECEQISNIMNSFVVGYKKFAAPTIICYKYSTILYCFTSGKINNYSYKMAAH